MDAGVFFCPRIAHLRAAVRAGIVNEQKLKVGKGLGEYALYTGVQRFFRLVDRHYNADSRHLLVSFIVDAGQMNQTAHVGVGVRRMPRRNTAIGRKGHLSEFDGAIIQCI